MVWVRRELRRLSIPPLKRFGQHFLLNQQIRDELIDQADISAADTVVEVGPGLGFLTSALASRAGRVVAIEKDRTLAKHLEEKFSAQSNVKVIHGDALAIPIPDNSKIVSSPPYNISSKLVLQILSSQYKLACLLLQEEFVRRLTAAAGSRDYGRLTVMLQTCARAEHISRVPKSAFYPEPRVDSAIAKITPIHRSVAPSDYEVFEDLVRALFTQRRRKLRGVLSRYLAVHYGKEKADMFAGIDLCEKRVYELHPEDFVKLSNLITDSVKK